MQRPRDPFDASIESITDPASLGLAEAIIEVEVAWQCARSRRSAHLVKDLTGGRKIAERLLDSFPTCPFPGFRRLGYSWTHWKATFFTY